MEIRCCSFSKMASVIKKKKQRIILFGAGVIGTVTVPEILYDHELLDYVECYIDNDSKKWGTEIEIRDKNVKVFSAQYLERLNEDSVVLLNISRYAEVINQLERSQCSSRLTCYIMPMMCIYNYCNDNAFKDIIKDFEFPVIPKKIHYMWLGGKELPKNLQKCVDSWKKYCPDYEIIRWDETNYDMSKNLYTEQAYKNKEYGFVPDYARLDILYNYGGIYMDTDVELIRPLDELLYQEAFCGVEKWQVLNFGGCSGAIEKHRAIKKILEYRENVFFVNADGEKNKTTCGYYDTKAVLDAGYKMNGQNQKVLDMNIYSYDYFHPYDYMSGRLDVTENTFSIHHFNGGWLDKKMKQLNEETAHVFDAVCENTIFDDAECGKYRWIKKKF